MNILEKYNEISVIVKLTGPNPKSREYPNSEYHHVFQHEHEKVRRGNLKFKEDFFYYCPVKVRFFHQNESFLLVSSSLQCSCFLKDRGRKVGSFQDELPT